jgi:zinc transport system substrate-binding protein
VVGDVDGEVLAGGTDPHVWLDPVRFAAMVGAIASALSELDPAGRAEFTSNAQRYTAALAALDGEFRSGLSNCESRVIVTSHRAFGYLASRYNLRQIPIAGIAPDEEPNPRSMAAVSAAARRENVKTVFFESLVPRKLADTIAKEIGAATDALNPIEGLTAAERTQGLTYRSI